MLDKIAEPLLNWYEGHARKLPWRELPSPYRVWVSEIMLQQTRVEAVKPFFERFTQSLPDVAALAECPEEKLLKLWEGLGYYNRVRNMQKAAKVLIEEYQASLPADYQELLKLPGIGHYTAGAIASIAYGIPVPAVDGNVLRVISRVAANDEDIMKQTVRNKIEEQLKAVMPKEKAGAFNQALMELGAMICVPNGMARCEECPLSELCLAKKQNIVMELPKKTRKKPRRLEEHTILVIKDGERVALRKRPGKGLLAGLYEFPNAKGHLSEEDVLKVIKGFKLVPLRIQKLEASKHIFSHVEWHMIGYVIKIEDRDGGEESGSDLLFVEPIMTEDSYPIPAAFEAYTQYMNIRIGQKKYSGS